MKSKTGKEQEGQDKPAPKPIVRIVLSVILIAAGIGGARYLIHTKPKVNRRPPARMAPLVKTMVLMRETYRINIPAMGLVVPAQETVLKVPVGGEIIDLSPEFTPGGLLQEKGLMLQIDPKDYQLALQQKKRSLSDAEYAYKLELGRQDVARREWNLLYGGNKAGEVESELALRKPHLEKAQADIEAAKAELELARIDLDRTKVTAPFNALVLNKYVDLGSHVSPQEKLADLVGTDAYWVQVSVPVENLKWIKIPSGKAEEGATVTIQYRENNKRQGKVVRMLADLSKEGRMARLLVEVKDPLDLRTMDDRQPPMLIGEYVRVLIDGAPLPDVYRIPRFALHNDNQVWLADREHKLAARTVQPVWREEEYVYVRDGLHPDDQLIISTLSAPVDGMDLRLENTESKAAGETTKQIESSEQQKP